MKNSSNCPRVRPQGALEMLHPTRVPCQRPASFGARSWHKGDVQQKSWTIEIWICFGIVSTEVILFHCSFFFHPIFLRCFGSKCEKVGFFPQKWSKSIAGTSRLALQWSSRLLIVSWNGGTGKTRKTNWLRGNLKISQEISYQHKLSKLP